MDGIKWYYLPLFAVWWLFAVLPRNVWRWVRGIK
jgi:hypothetical protein